MLLMLYLAMEYGVEKADMTLAKEQNEAEKEMIKYNIKMIGDLK